MSATIQHLPLLDPEQSLPLAKDIVATNAHWRLEAAGVFAQQTQALLAGRLSNASLVAATSALDAIVDLKSLPRASHSDRLASAQRAAGGLCEFLNDAKRMLPADLLKVHDDVLRRLILIRETTAIGLGLSDARLRLEGFNPVERIRASRAAPVGLEARRLVLYDIARSGLLPSPAAKVVRDTVLASCAPDVSREAAARVLNEAIDNLAGLQNRHAAAVDVENRIYVRNWDRPGSRREPPQRSRDGDGRANGRRIDENEL